jgi:RNA polymerase sigma-70 factor (ECF subfamily)
MRWSDEGHQRLKADWEGDRDPLAALQHGDSAPFEQFVHSEGRAFVSFFVRRGAPLAEAEDLTQEVFVKLYENAADYRPQGSFEAYALRVARNAWVDQRRRAASREPTGSAASPCAATEELRSREDDPSSAAQVRDEWARLTRALAELDESHALAFELGVLRGRPYAEVASALGIPLGTVKSRVHYAVRKLRAALESPRLPELRSGDLGPGGRRA